MNQSTEDAYKQKNMKNKKILKNVEFNIKIAINKQFMLIKIQIKM